MTRYDLLKMNYNVLRIFLDNKIDVKDVEKLAIFEEFINMRNRKEKFSYVVEHLAEKYKCSSRSVTNIVNRMRADIEINL